VPTAVLTMLAPAVIASGWAHSTNRATAPTKPTHRLGYASFTVSCGDMIASAVDYARSS
jgi:hypothetical protein